MSISGGRQEVIGTATSQEGTEWSGERREKGKRRVTIMLSWISREFFFEFGGRHRGYPMGSLLTGCAYS